MKKEMLSLLDALAKVPGIAYASDDWGQVDREDLDTMRYPVKYPAALLAAESSITEYPTKDLCRERITYVVRLLDAPSTTASATAPTKQREASLAIYSIRDAVIGAMQTQGCKYMGLRRLPRPDGLRELDLLFESVIKTER